MECQNKVKQISLAVQEFHTSLGRFPPQFGWLGTVPGGGNSGDVGTIFFHLLPHLEMKPLWQVSYIATNTSQNYPCSYTQIAGTHDSRETVGSEELPIYSCSDDISRAYTLPNWGWGGSSYATNFQLFGKPNSALYDSGTCDPTAAAMWQGRATMADIRDGTSNTIIVAEKFGAIANPPGLIRAIHRIGIAPSMGAATCGPVGMGSIPGREPSRRSSRARPRSFKTRRCRSPSAGPAIP